MEPVYLARHSRSMQNVMHNLEGDLIFSCSDDGTVYMYEKCFFPSETIW